jgi:hypothetical protein
MGRESPFRRNKDLQRPGNYKDFHGQGNDYQADDSQVIYIEKIHYLICFYKNLNNIQSMKQEAPLITETPESLPNGLEDRSELKQPGDKLPRIDEIINFEGPTTTITAFGRTIVSKPTILR